MSSKKKNYQIDVANMAKGNIVSPARLKKMSKKQRTAIGKNTVTLGFDVGFTRKVLLDLVRLQNIKKLKPNKQQKKKKENRYTG